MENTQRTSRRKAKLDPEYIGIETQNRHKVGIKFGESHDSSVKTSQESENISEEGHKLSGPTTEAPPHTPATSAPAILEEIAEVVEVDEVFEKSQENISEKESQVHIVPNVTPSTSSQLNIVSHVTPSTSSQRTKSIYESLLEQFDTVASSKDFTSSDSEPAFAPTHSSTPFQTYRQPFTAFDFNDINNSTDNSQEINQFPNPLITTPLTTPFTSSLFPTNPESSSSFFHSSFFNPSKPPSPIRRPTTPPSPVHIRVPRMTAPVLTPQLLTSTTIPIFDSDKDDPAEYITNYDAITTAGGWNSDAKKNFFTINLGPVGREWFTRYLVTVPTADWTATKAAFIANFTRRGSPNRAEALLKKRVQLPTEGVDSYYYDVLKLCNRIDSAMAEQKKIRLIINNLTPNLFEKTYTLTFANLDALRTHLHTLEDAEHSFPDAPYFKKTNKRDTDIAELKNMVCTLTNHTLELKNTKPPQPITTITNRPTQPQNTPYNHYNSPPPPQPNPNFGGGRGRARNDVQQTVGRTADGVVICYRCTQPGHIASKCENQPFCSFCHRPNHQRRDCRSLKQKREQQAQYPPQNNQQQFSRPNNQQQYSQPTNVAQPASSAFLNY